MYDRNSLFRCIPYFAVIVLHPSNTLYVMVIRMKVGGIARHVSEGSQCKKKLHIR